MANKKVAVINTQSFGSTGQIARAIMNAYEGESRLFCFREKEKFDNVTAIELSKLSDLASHSISRIDGNDGFHYHAFSEKLIKELDEYKPDIIHLHNLHGYYLNVPILFNFIKEKNIKVIWTLHDFWPLTGRCAVPGDCENFLTGCQTCLNKGNYPFAILHNEKEMFPKRKELFTSLENVTIVTPSEYLMNYVKQTHLNKYPGVVINNGIDLEKFFYEESDLKEKLEIPQDKKVLLSVMLPISSHKGIEYINKLASELDDKYLILLVGTNDDNFELSSKIKHIPFVSQEELHLYYSMADLFINPTLSDTYPTVDMEAIASGLQILSYDTGGSKEIVTLDVGRIVARRDYEAFKNSIEDMVNHPLPKENFLKRRENFSKERMIEKYLKLYK